MAVNLSPVGGVAAQFFTNSGVPLTGGKIFTYAAGTTTPQASYTTSQGNVAWTNPIVLDAAGRVPSSGEIWLTDGLIYKFVLKDANDVLIATYDNITGINPTVNAENVVYNPPLTGAVATNVEAKLAQTVSVKDFGAVGDGVTDDTTAIQDALDSGTNAVYVPAGTYLVSTKIEVPSNLVLYGDGAGSVLLATSGIVVVGVTGTSGSHKSNAQVKNLKIRRTGNSGIIQLVELLYADDCLFENVILDGGSSTYPGSLVGYSVNRLQVVGCQFIGGAACQLTSEGALNTNPFSTGCVVKNCYMAPAAHQGFDFYYVDDLIVDGCIAHGRTSTYGCGFIIEYEATNVTFTNCISYDNTRSGFYAEPNVAYGLASITFNNCIGYNNGEAGLYSQNSFGLVINGGAYWGSTTSFSGSNGGIALEDVAENCVVTGAYIHSNQVCGLRIAQGNGVTVTGNLFYNNNGPAINITNTSVGVNVAGNTFKSNSSVVSGWIESQTGTFPDYAWASYTPLVYSNDGTTTVTISNSSVKYKRIGSTCFVEGYFEFSGSANNSVMYVQMPFTGNWAAGTSAAAKVMRGVANGSNAGVIYMDGIYYNDRLAINGMGVADTNVRFTASFEIA